MADTKATQANLDRIRDQERARKKQQEEMERLRQKVISESAVKSTDIGTRFEEVQEGAAAAKFKQATYGLTTIDEYRQKRMELEEDSAATRPKAGQGDQAATTSVDDSLSGSVLDPKAKQTLAKRSVLLSFGGDDGDGLNNDEDNEVLQLLSKRAAKKPRKAIQFDDTNQDPLTAADPPPIAKRLGKDPTVDSSFLPDREREREEKRARAQLEAEWEEKQNKIKQEPITIVYSYWNGTGHRFQVTVNKGDTVGMFLEKCRAMLLPHFKELKGVSSDNLMYVKEDLILPHHYSFYHFIVTKARGKSGPLFRFDVHEDIRLEANAQVEKDDSHAGKVLERSWYQKNKHIFPYNRYEVFDPAKTYDKYTIG